MKVLLADDHAILRQGLRSLLADEAQVEIVAEASDGREAVELTEKHQPDIIIMDISMPLLTGLEATRQIKARFPDIKIIMLSMHAQDSFVIQALQFGAHAYILKKAVFDEMKLALDAAQNGEYYLSPAISRVLIDQLFQSSHASPYLTSYEKLTQREREVLQLMLEKRSRKDIAQILSISPKTVDKHQENIKDKLEVYEEEDLLQFAKLIGILKP